MCVYVLLHACVYIYVCACTCVCVCICVCAHVYVCECVHTCVYVHVHMCGRLCGHVCAMQGELLNRTMSPESHVFGDLAGGLDDVENWGLFPHPLHLCPIGSHPWNSSACALETLLSGVHPGFVGLGA